MEMVAAIRKRGQVHSSGNRTRFLGSAKSRTGDLKLRRAERMCVARECLTGSTSGRDAHSTVLVVAHPAIVQMHLDLILKFYVQRACGKTRAQFEHSRTGDPGVLGGGRGRLITVSSAQRDPAHQSEKCGRRDRAGRLKKIAPLAPSAQAPTEMRDLTRRTALPAFWGMLVHCSHPNRLSKFQATPTIGHFQPQFRELLHNSISRPIPRGASDRPN